MGFYDQNLIDEMKFCDDPRSQIDLFSKNEQLQYRKKR